MSAAQPQRWQAILAGAHRTVAELAAALNLSPDLFCPGAAESFPLVVPQPYLSRIRPGDPADPLLLQVLASAHELESVVGYSCDPVGEQAAIPVNGMIRRFAGRVLVAASGACGINCRYCFRRHFPYREQVPDRQQWQSILDYIASDQTVTEAILSGGDPLVLNDQHLDWIVGELATIEHLRRIRIHTRMPVVIPARITSALLATLSRCEKQVVVVIHSNHPAELDQEVAGGLAALRKSGVTLLNQSVLLRGINDSADTLIALGERLFACGVLPYYLHLLDRVTGAAHFDVAERDARTLMREVSAALPGYLVPRLVRDTPGATAKESVPR